MNPEMWTVLMVVWIAGIAAFIEKWIDSGREH
jgi:predicted membrane channel-forming protein YqfA (hemolysin III family)